MGSRRIEPIWVMLNVEYIARIREQNEKNDNPASRGVVALERHYVTLRYSNVIVLGHCLLV